MGEEGRARGNVIIRPEGPGDAAQVRRVVEAAFGRAEEADLVDALRSEALLSLVAEEEGEVAGHLMLSALEAPFAACALAPLAVEPLWQRHGVGTALVREAIGRTGCAAMFVLGEPRFYERFGFSADLAAGYACAFSGPYFQVLPLRDIPPTGRILYPQAFR